MLRSNNNENIGESYLSSISPTFLSTVPAVTAFALSPFCMTNAVWPCFLRNEPEDVHLAAAAAADGGGGGMVWD
jgi:hypothetical protein